MMNQEIRHGNKINSINHNQVGFTLIEVLVATIIMVATLASVSLLYKGSITSSIKASAHVEVAGVTSAVIANVQREIRSQSKGSANKLAGNGKAFKVGYRWNATQVSFKPAQRRYDQDEGEFVVGPAKYKLWLVNLNLLNQGVEIQHQYYEVSWNES